MRKIVQTILQVYLTDEGHRGIIPVYSYTCRIVSYRYWRVDWSDNQGNTNANDALSPGVART